MHWLLLAIILTPFGAMLGWALVSLRQLSALARENDDLLRDLERRHPWLREE
jgi:hypothetical protein